MEEKESLKSEQNIDEGSGEEAKGNVTENSTQYPAGYTKATEILSKYSSEEKETMTEILGDLCQLKPIEVAVDRGEFSTSLSVIGVWPEGRIWCEISHDGRLSYWTHTGGDNHKTMQEAFDMLKASYPERQAKNNLREVEVRISERKSEITNAFNKEKKPSVGTHIVHDYTGATARNDGKYGNSAVETYYSYTDEQKKELERRIESDEEVSSINKQRQNLLDFLQKK